VWLLFLTGLSCCMHSPVRISVAANREGKVLITVAHLRGDIMSIFTYMYTKGQDMGGTGRPQGKMISLVDDRREHYVEVDLG